MPHIHQKTQHCGLNIYRVDQCHQISEEIEHNKSSLPILDPSENTLPPVVLCYCSYSGHNPHSGQKVRSTELLKFAAKIKKGRLLLGGSDWCNSFIWLLLLKEKTYQCIQGTSLFMMIITRPFLSWNIDQPRQLISSIIQDTIMASDDLVKSQDM